MRHLYLFTIAAALTGIGLNAPVSEARGVGAAHVAAPRVAPHFAQRPPALQRAQPQINPQRTFVSRQPTAQSDRGRVSSLHDDRDHDRHHHRFFPGSYYFWPAWGSYDWGYPGYWTDGSDNSDEGYANDAVSPPINGAVALGQPPVQPQLPPIASPNVTRASAEVAGAQAEMDAARSRVLTLLWDRPEYKSAVAQKQAAEARVDALHASGQTSFEQILPAATRALQAREQVTRIESAAMASDPQVIEARAHLAAAVAMRNSP